MAPIVVNDLCKFFGSQAAVDRISFGIEQGRVTGFLGPNGAGKSTTLRMILGLVHPTSGEAAILGRSYSELNDPLRAVGAVLDTSQFHPQRSGRNHLRMLAASAGISGRRIDQVLELVGLAGAARKRAGQYSLGMRQRLGIAAGLLGDPQVLVLDEPANGLDPAGIRWLRNLLRSLAAEGRTVFMSSHLLSEVSEIADDVIVIDRGRLVIQSSVQELMGRAIPQVRVESAQPERLRGELESAGIAVNVASHRDLLVNASREAVGTIAAAAGIPIFRLIEQERSLEDIFFELTSVEAIR